MMVVDVAQATVVVDGQYHRHGPQDRMDHLVVVSCHRPVNLGHHP